MASSKRPLIRWDKNYHTRPKFPVAVFLNQKLVTDEVVAYDCEAGTVTRHVGSGNLITDKGSVLVKRMA